MTTLLIDGDTLIYRYGLMNPDNDMPTFGNTEPLALLERAKLAFAEKLEYLLIDTGATEYRIALALPGVRCYRYDVYSGYKGHRKPPPPIIGELKAWVRLEYEKQMLPVPDGIPLETDDILGWHQEPDGSTIIVSNDKDMLTIPGVHYHPFKQEFYTVSTQSADLTVLYQMLVGDNADGFGGCPGIGKVKAQEILLRAIVALGSTSLEDLWPSILFTFVSQGSTEPEARRMYQMVRIIRRGDDLEEYPRPPSTLMPSVYYDVLEVLNDQTK